MVSTMSLEPTLSWISQLLKSEFFVYKENIKSLVKDYEFSHVTVEIEYGESDCAMS